MKKLIFGVRPIKYPKKKLKKGGTSKVTPPDLGMVAIWNEYGTDKIPPRPAFRTGLEESQRINKKLIQAQVKNIAQRILQGRKSEIDRSLTVVLTQIGKSAVSATKEIIKNGSTTPNAPLTIANKGFDHPLFETGLLLENVTYEVIE